jgi:hypothetical protein
MLYRPDVDLKALVTLAGQTDEKTFLERHPHPGLILKKKGRPSSDEQFASDLDWRTRTKKDLYAKPGATPPPKKDSLAKMSYFPIVKSTRNPFAAMITVGRTPNNDVCLASSSVSKLHAYFQQESGQWVIRDSMSSFGTFVDGTRIPTDKSMPVHDGSTIGFGPDTECVFLGPKALFEYLRRLGGD